MVFFNELRPVRRRGLLPGPISSFYARISAKYRPLVFRCD